jgi:hypothetical protein
MLEGLCSLKRGVRVFALEPGRYCSRFRICGSQDPNSLQFASLLRWRRNRLTWIQELQPALAQLLV